MKLYNVLTLCVPLVLMPLTVYSSDVFDELDAEVESYAHPDADKIKAEYTKFIADYLNEYDQWRKGYLTDFDNAQSKIIKKWGDDDTANKQRNVEYSKDLTSKAVIDYQNNEAVVEVLVDSTVSTEEAQKILADKIARLVKDKGANIAELSSSIKEINPENITVETIEYSDHNEKKAKDVIIQQTVSYMQEADKRADKLLTENSRLSPEIIENAVAEKKKELQKEEQGRLAVVAENYQSLRQHGDAQLSENSDSIKPETQKKVKYKVKLPKNSLAKRAEKYTDFAERESKEFGVPAALIMAIMHSESAFDPNAKSPVPAYGLMQIVPRTAGHDVNKLVRNIDKPMQAKELYVPDVNVQTGSAYLSILDKRYLKSIKNPQSRLYCTIAAYNTGAGNVAKVFNKKGQGNTRNIKRAAQVINQLSPQEVYDALMAKLPYDETKHYLQKVSSRIPLYEI
ncbi:transglycosylase SLT domain-containing protein [Psychromonas sp.]|uniref:transglycosylase SLT domain-containing protein n=1 Tax=Psychromonas sp. TaxID=1884585 RepID=UPI0035691C67